MCWACWAQEEESKWKLGVGGNMARSTYQYLFPSHSHPNKPPQTNYIAAEKSLGLHFGIVDVNAVIIVDVNSLTVVILLLFGRGRYTERPAVRACSEIEQIQEIPLGDQTKVAAAA